MLRLFPAQRRSPLRSIPRVCSAASVRRPQLRPLSSGPTRPETDSDFYSPASHSSIPRADAQLFRPSGSYRCPSQVLAEELPRKFRELPNDTLSYMATQGIFGARKERLLREIMRVDGVSWEEARTTLARINSKNDEGRSLMQLPYKVGVACGVFGALGSLPMVFHKETAIWFNERYVHCDPPDGGYESLDGMWAVGSWTWNWMEPPLGTLSFLLLGFQLARVHLEKMHWKPYTAWILSRRADRLARHFPQYERQIVRDFSKSDPWHE